jgi:hypothetical protein
MDKQGHFEKGKWISQECIECSERYAEILKEYGECYEAMAHLSKYETNYYREKINCFEKMNLWQRLRWAITGKVNNG